MIKPVKYFLIFGSALLLSACGDSESDQPPPIEGIQLTERMLESMANKDYGTATLQYRKLLDARSEEFTAAAVGLRPVIETNQIVFAVQQLLDAGRFDEALAFARDAKQRDPANAQIDSLLGQLVYVDSLRLAARSVRTADNTRELSASLETLRGLIADNPKAQPLKRFVEVRSYRLAGMRQIEDRRARVDLLAEYYRLNSSGDWLAPAVQAECELEFRRSRMDPLPEVVRNELYPHAR